MTSPVAPAATRTGAGPRGAVIDGDSSIGTTGYDLTQLQLHARLAGFLFLFYIAALALGSIVAGPVVVDAEWQRTSDQVASASTLHRWGLTLQLLGGIDGGSSWVIALHPAATGQSRLGSRSLCLADCGRLIERLRCDFAVRVVRASRRSRSWTPGS